MRACVVGWCEWSQCLHKTMMHYAKPQSPYKSLHSVIRESLVATTMGPKKSYRRDPMCHKLSLGGPLAFHQIDRKSKSRRESLFLCSSIDASSFYSVSGSWHQILFRRCILTVPVPERMVLSGEAEMINGIFVMSWVLVMERLVGWLTSFFIELNCIRPQSRFIYRSPVSKSSRYG